MWERGAKVLTSTRKSRDTAARSQVWQHTTVLHTGDKADSSLSRAHNVSRLEKLTAAAASSCLAIPPRSSTVPDEPVRARDNVRREIGGAAARTPIMLRPGSSVKSVYNLCIASNNRGGREDPLCRERNGPGRTACIGFGRRALRDRQARSRANAQGARVFGGCLFRARLYFSEIKLPQTVLPFDDADILGLLRRRRDIHIRFEDTSSRTWKRIKWRTGADTSTRQ